MWPRRTCRVLQPVLSSVNRRCFLGWEPLGCNLRTNRQFQTLPLPNEDLEGLTNISERVFEALFKGVSTRFGLQNVEKCFENEQNLRLGSIYFDKTHHPIGRIILSSCDFDGRIDILPSIIMLS